MVAAPEFAPGVMEIFAKWKNLRVMRIAEMARLESFVGARVRGFQEPHRRGHHRADGIRAEDAADGGFPSRRRPRTRERSTAWRAPPTERELDDLLFGWLVETGVTSNSVIYVKDGATVGIGTGEQDRVGCGGDRARQGVPKARGQYSLGELPTPYYTLEKPEARAEIDREVARQKGGIAGSCMVSDGFFPFRDGVEVGIREGVTADRAAREGRTGTSNPSRHATRPAVAMVFTGQRSFKH